jgi:hypothetical protein
MIEWTPGLTLADVERLVILKALKYFQGNKTKTAASLKMATRTLDYKLKEYGEKTGTEIEDHNSEATGRGVAVQPNAEVSTEQSLSVRKRLKIQKVLPSENATVHSKQGGS